jgi:ABC-type transport system involved in Fe-S cluster assembly fused permease/ATPase subunit
VCRRVSLAVFGHVLDLDLSFHLSRKTGEVTKVVDRGTSAIQNVLSTILFQIVPQVRAKRVCADVLLHVATFYCRQVRICDWRL